MKMTKNKGFTLIETLVAITILVIAVLGPMTLLARSIADGFFARDQMISSFLAQEGIELAIEKRNKEGIWWNDITCNPCIIEWTVGGINLASGGASEIYKTPDGHYVHSDVGDNQLTIFERQIFTTPIDIDGFNDAVRVESKVSWTYSGGTQETSITTVIFTP